MENLESVSDCSEYSRNSECQESNTSTFSGLSDYQGEFFELQRSIHPKKILNVFKPKEHCSSRTGEQYSLGVFKKKNAEIVVLKQKSRSLQKAIQQLTEQNVLLTSEFQQKNEIENEYRDLKMDLAALDLELSAKVNCVTQLKVKVSEQHVEFQSILQQNIKLTRSLEAVTSDLEYVKKCADWYKEELHQLQNEKNALSNDTLVKIKTIALHEQQIEQLKLELNQCKCSYDTLYLSLIREKEKQVVVVQDKDLSSKSEGITSSGSDIENITDYYEAAINDLKCEISRLMQDLRGGTKKNAALLSTCLLLENSLREKEQIIENLDFTKKDLKMRLSSLLDKESQHNTDLLHLQNKCSQLDVELNRKMQEQVDVEQTIKVIKEQFKMFKNTYIKLKCEVNERDKVIMQMQLDKQELLRKEMQLNQIIIEVKSKVGQLKKGAMERIELLKEKCSLLEMKGAENQSLLNLLCNNKNESDDVKHLRALLQVKVLEIEEHHERYKRNYRTLLRKLKEHKKGRNEAEKQNLELRELHKSLSTDHEHLQSQINLKDLEMDKLKTSIHSNLNEIENLKLTVLKLERNDHTFSNDAERVQCEMFGTVGTTKTEDQELFFKTSVLEINNGELCAKVNSLENALLQETIINADLTTELTSTKRENGLSNERIASLLQHNGSLLQKIEVARSLLQRKSEELEEWRQNKARIKNKLSEEESSMQSLVYLFKMKMRAFEREIDTMKREKKFMQRLCNDLYAALKVHIHNNMVFTKYASNQCKERERYQSLPVKVAKFPVPSYQDDVYINKLLQESGAHCQAQSSNEIQGCFDELRQEIVLLQGEMWRNDNSI